MSGRHVAPLAEVPGEQVCDRCGQAPGVVPLALSYWCDGCTDEIRGRTMMVEGFDGIGRPTEPRPEFGPGYHNLECDQCQASWVGRSGSSCNYCAGLGARSLAEQPALLLRPVLPVADSPNRLTAEMAWAERLANAVKAGVVTEIEARRALERVVIPNVA